MKRSNRSWKERLRPPRAVECGTLGVVGGCVDLGGFRGEWDSGTVGRWDGGTVGRWDGGTTGNGITG